MGRPRLSSGLVFRGSETARAFKELALNDPLEDTEDAGMQDDDF